MSEDKPLRLRKWRAYADVVEIQHDGVTASGYDMGWSLYPGLGGWPDEQIAGWRPLSPSGGGE